MHYDRGLYLLSAAGVFGLGACAGADAPASAGPSVALLESPAGSGSGEPFLSTSGDGVVLSWLEKAGEEHVLWMSRLDERGFGTPTEVTRGDDFFVNWADFPSVTTAPDGRLWAHWLQNVSDQRMAYGVRVSHSADGGATWSEPWTPHEDGTPTEHGFVSLFPTDGGMGVAWLDGRGYAASDDDSPPAREMSVRFRAASAEGPLLEDAPIDTRTCDCCQTDVAVSDRGPVLVYRDRSPEEVRDIYVTRREGGAWTEPHAVHADGWVIAGCPVNGPAVAARDSRVAVAWFTAPGDAPEVRFAWSDDAGDTFGAAVRIDGGDPAGRVDVVLDERGDALVSWLERTGGEGAELRVRRVSANGTPGDPLTVTSSSSARASGFPRIAPAPGDPSALVVAWTDVAAEGGARVRVARVVLP